MRLATHSALSNQRYVPYVRLKYLGRDDFQSNLTGDKHYTVDVEPAERL